MSFSMAVRIGLCASVLATCAVRHANAQSEDLIAVYLTGESLTTYCRSYLSLAKTNFRTSTVQEAYEAGYCQAYVTGVLDTFSFRGDDDPSENERLLPPFCIRSQDATARSLTEVVARYVDSHPEQRTQTAYSLVRRALAQSYPCNAD